MRLWRVALVLNVAVACALAGTVATTVSAAAHDDEDDRPYLALGDSVSFGFIAQAGFEYVNADNFVGYPAYTAPALRLNPVEASCPGETTGSFLASRADDNGCRAYRAQAPLHVPYGSTQMAFATAFLRSHRDTRLVTITLGANDLILLDSGCAGDPACVAAGLPQALALIRANMDTILSRLRSAGFRRTIVVANYYSPDYNDPVRTGAIQLLNQALTAAAEAHGAAIADAFTAFRTAAATVFAGGSPCRAGLLNALPAVQFQCDIHPSQSGQRLIAQAVRGAVRREMRNLEE
jgi:lysophospholipase L1-like esterase